MRAYPSFAHAAHEDARRRAEAAMAEGAPSPQRDEAAIRALCAAHGRAHLAADFIAHGCTPAEVKAALIAQARPPAVPIADADPGAAFRHYVNNLSASEIDVGWQNAFAVARGETPLPSALPAAGDPGRALSAYLNSLSVSEIDEGWQAAFDRARAGQRR
jgi:hypothetical protein